MEKKFILKNRPEVRFDPANGDHRHAFTKFVRNRQWRDAPRFYLEEGYSCIPEMIKDKLLKYYINQEFKITPTRSITGK